MRRACPILVALVVLAGMASPSAAEEWSAAGSVGVGAFGDAAASHLEAGLDLEAGRWRLGLGARLNFLQGEGLRNKDWDQSSEWAQIVRYLTYRRDSGDKKFALAAGRLGDATLGRGTVITGLTTGLNADRHRVGLQMRGENNDVGGELLIDDVAAPRLLGARLKFKDDALRVAGVSVVREMGDPLVDARTTLAGELSVRKNNESGRVQLEAGASGVARIRRGGGVHAQSGVTLLFSDEFYARGSLEVAARFGGYRPWRYGPLYEVERLDDEDMVTGRLWGRVGLDAEHDRIGNLHLEFQKRPGTSDLTVLSLQSPHYSGLQAAGWVALARQDSRTTDAGLGAELRLRASDRVYVSSEVSRRYTEDQMGQMVPLWSAFASIGLTAGTGAK